MSIRSKKSDIEQSLDIPFSFNDDRTKAAVVQCKVNPSHGFIIKNRPRMLT
jgi:hypothetical protein